MAMEDFLNMPARDRALVAIAVLLDGMEASVYLDDNAEMKKHAAWFAALQSELRMPLLGSLLRKSLSEFEK
jgi:hypothetical protein